MDVKLKKPYTRPTLTEFGSVAKLTRGATGSRVDSGSKTPALPPPIIRH
jgi:hypothetical protein